MRLDVCGCGADLFAEGDDPFEPVFACPRRRCLLGEQSVPSLAVSWNPGLLPEGDRTSMWWRLRDGR